MLHLRSVSLPTIRDSSGNDAFPFSVPAVRHLGTLELSSPVTFFVGENGSGKSTLIEGLAAATTAVTVGGEDIARDPTLAHARALAARLKLSWQHRTRKGFFLRSEDFFRFLRRMQAERDELAALEEEFSSKYEGYGRMLAMGAARGQRGEFEARYGRDTDARSHGESFLDFFRARLVPGGLYLLDEPEAALSPQRQLAFLVILKDMVEENCQFVIATHSPILMAFPGAVVVSFDSVPPAPVAYDELEHVRFTRDFLSQPERYLRRL